MRPYFFHISLYDLAFLVTISIALNFALLLWFTRKTNRAANRFLAAALVGAALSMARVLAIDIGLTAYIPSFSLAFGPLIFFYVRKLTQPDHKFGRKDLLHFIPVVSEQITVTKSELPFLVFISTAVYLYWCQALVERFYQSKTFTSGDRYRHELRWLHRLLAGFGLLWLLSIPFAVAGNYQFLYLLLMLILIWVTARIYLRPEDMVPVLKPLLPVELKTKAAWLKKTVKEKRYYLDPELSLRSLAEKLGLTTHELSRVLNSALKKSFNDFINEYRVQEAIRKMQDSAYDHITLMGIAYDSGFNSNNTFYRAFREITGQTPAEYKKELPSYNLTYGSVVAQATLQEQSNRNFMIKNYLKIAWRNTLRNKAYSALNITGLATGMAVALLIGLWVFNQFSYDRFLPGYEQAYAVEVNYTNSHDGTYTQNQVALPLADVLRNDIPGIQHVAEADFVDFPGHDFMVGDKKMLVDGGTAAPDFLKIFQYPLVKGNVNTVLKDPSSIVIDESTASLLFGNDDPINKTIKIDNAHDVKVTGVMKDFPANASFQFHFLLPFSFAEHAESFVRNARNQWDNNSFQIFVGLQPGVTGAQIGSKIKNLVAEHNPPSRAYKPEVFLYPLKDWHLHSEFKNGKVAGGFIDYVRMFGIIGALVLLIACINFVNLSTARSEKRAREVGVRKAIGAPRRDLILQFLSESVLITFIASLLSIALVQLALPGFNSLTGGLVQIPYESPVFWCIMTGYVLLVGLLAGMRPAFYLSAFNPVKVLKGTFQTGKAATLPRKILVVLQFSCSVAFIISTVIIYQQIQYAKDRPTGFSSDGLASTFMTQDLVDHYDALKNDLLASGMVENVTRASSPVTQIGWHTGISQWPGQNAGEQKINVGAVIIDNVYFKTVGMKLLAGQNFSGDFNTDANSVIVNETAVKRMGLKDPINQLIIFDGISGRSRIVGMIKDAVMGSPFTPVEPTVFVHIKGWNSQVIYHLMPGIGPHTAIEKIGKIFDKYNPAYPFSYVFANEAYDRKFNLETLVGKLAGIFAGLAIFVSCLGLFGLAAYVAEQRTKEIAVRKVLGASITQVWTMLSGDFILLVIISCIIASPVALYFLHGWLQKYDYRISIGPGVFLLSAVATVIITLITISFQAVKAALANPVKSLRSE